jgi:hypothetical protein
MNWYKTSQINVEKEWIDKLDELQKIKNDGRGVTCVKSIVAFLRMNMVKDAIATYHWDSDKIRNYPDINKMIKEKFGIQDVFDTIFKDKYK